MKDDNHNTPQPRESAMDGGENFPSTDLLEQTFAHLGEAMLIVAISSRQIVRCNPAVAQVFGYSVEELVGKTTEVLHIDHKHYLRFHDETRPLLEKQNWCRLEFRMQRRDGQIIDTENYISAIRDQTGSITAVISLVRDITARNQAMAERLEAEKALRQSEAQHRLIFDMHPNPMWVYDLETLCFLRVNDAAINRYGYSHGDFMAMTIKDIRPQEDVPALLENIAKAAGGPTSDGIWRHIIKDGRVIQVEIFSQPLDYNGRKAELVLAVDVTQRLEAEARIREQANYLDKANDAIVAYDQDNHIIYWNKGAEKLFGWRAEQAIGQQALKLMGVAPTQFEKAGQAVRKSGSWKGELKKYDQNGNELVLESRWSLIDNPGGEMTDILSINTDITRQKQLDEQLQRTERIESLGTLAGGIAHDLNNTLQPIMMATDLLLQEAADEQQQKLVETIRDSTKRAADLVKQVLTFARGTTGNRERLQVMEIINTVEKIIRETFPKNIRFTVEAVPDLWPVEGDATQLQQVLLNLCINARDAMPKGGNLSISLQNTGLDEFYVGLNPGTRPGSHVLITVTDTGTGINPATRHRILDPFFTTKEIGQGTGLGLSTANAIVRSHGGLLNFYSERGRGTQFKIYLPAVTEAGEASTQQIGAQELPRGHGERVLLVDDESHVRAIVSKTLQRHNYEVLVASNGAEAVACYARDPAAIDVVLTDMAMPVMDGGATILALKAINPDVRIIASSGLSSNDGIAKAIGAGVSHFLPKPYSIDNLLLLLRRILDGE